ncbi:hypothetical protein Vadar_009616 [Vaccinium darrowii]|uniref:Uncharacterized protein n=1 Tax=Vaccinium darrowii TaxID=229202 RepID=A0ACB7WZT9_9ERIC|nr:hypothetical protein Vadar_009616 [Vaccinium darrowii]
MEAPAINEIRQRKKKSDESENAFEGEKEIPPSEEEIEICHDAELEKEIPPSGREKETLPHAERENEIPPNGNGKETSPDAKREKDTPPGDDICPICFGNYNIPCKTNCGHWFCANCVLSFWAYRSKILRCKCPICSQSISKFTPEASLNLRTEDDVVEALKKVQGYNRLFAGGVHGLILRLRQLPLFSGGFHHHIPQLLRMFYTGLYDPDHLLLNYVVARAMALILTLCYDYLDFDFLPGGFLGVNIIFECCTIGLVLLLGAIGLYRRIVANRRPRRRRRPRPNPISGPKNPPVQGPGSPPIQRKGPPVSGH